MGFAACVNLLVFVKVSFPGEGFPALTAFVRSLSAVNLLVNLQGGSVAEGFPTFITLVRLLPGMNSLVFDE